MRLVFVEDKLSTLEKVCKVGTALERWELYLVDWGYNTEAERAQSRSQPEDNSRERGRVPVGAHGAAEGEVTACRVSRVLSVGQSHLLMSCTFVSLNRACLKFSNRPLPDSSPPTGRPPRKVWI